MPDSATEMNAIIRSPGYHCDCPSEQLYNLTTMWIIGLDFIDPVGGIATAKRQQRIPAPFRPLFETAEWPTVPEIGGVLPTPAPETVKAAASSSARRRPISSSKPAVNFRCSGSSHCASNSQTMNRRAKSSDTLNPLPVRAMNAVLFNATNGCRALRQWSARGEQASRRYRRLHES